MNTVTRLAGLAFLLAAAMQCAARESSHIVAARTFPAPVPCTDPKNHYILDQPCGVLATMAPISKPGAIAVDRDGNVYFSSPNAVYKVDVDGMLTRVAGSEDQVPGFSGDGGPAVDALLDFPVTYPELEADSIDFNELVGPLALDDAGNLYIGDAYNNRIRKVDTHGIITTVVGGGVRGNFGFFPFAGDSAAANAVTLWWPQGIAFDSLGNLFIADSTGALLRVAPGGTTTALGWNNCGPAFAGPGLCAPEGLAVSAAGDVFVADGYCRVRKFGKDGEETVAGDELPDYRSNDAFTCGYSGDGGPATPAALAWPFGVAVDQAGTLFIADTYNDCVRAVDANGIIRTFAGRCKEPGTAPDSGPALVAGLRKPKGVAVDPAGNVYVADTENHCIRKVTSDGLMTTIAGQCK